MEPKTPTPPQLQIEVPGDLRASYANFAIINHSYGEIVIDLAHVIPNVPQTRVHTRLVLSPYHAKQLLHALGVNLANYEKRFGAIDMEAAGKGEGMPMGFPSSQVH